MKYLYTILLPIMLSGCVLFGTKPDTSVVTPKEIPIDRELLKKCSPIPKTEATDALDIRYIELIGLYGQCANRQNASISTIKTLANIKDKDE